jgi:hypothetical protein
MRLARLFVCLCLWLTAAALPAFAADAAPRAEEIRRAVQHVIVGEDIQTSPTMPAPPSISWWPKFHLPVGALKIGGWVVLAAAPALLLGLLAQAAVERWRRGPAPGKSDAGAGVAGATPLAPGAAAAAEASLDDILALAREGAFAEACHLLLLSALERLRRQRGARLAGSLTSRELLRELGLAEAPRAALGTLVREVEVSHFGGRPADRTRFERCLASYRLLAGEGGAEPRPRSEA